MARYAAALALFCAVALATRGPIPVAPAADKAAEKKGGKVAGILIEKKDKWVLVKADGETEPAKYLIGEKPDKKLADALKSTFDACRVELTYTKAGDALQLVGIKRQVLKATGTMTGKVVKVHNDFWVEVKPKTGVPDVFAPGGAFFKNKAAMDLLKGLRPGDSVTITYTTDFERHRIGRLKKN